MSTTSPKEDDPLEGDDEYDGNGDTAHYDDDPNLPPYKRAKRDPNIDPLHPEQSLVIHVRNLSYKATEADLLEALSHFGTIAYATCMPNKRMALVEFEDVAGAKACVDYAQGNEIYVAGQPALFNYSTSKYIQRLGLESEVPNHDVIYKIAKPYGEPKRIAMIRRQVLQALVEYDSIDIAREAKHAMNGADIYSGCCTLKVEFAKPETVKVTRNDTDQWDFTVPPESMVPQEIKDQIVGRKTLLAPEQRGAAAPCMPPVVPGPEYGYPPGAGAQMGSYGGARAPSMGYPPQATSNYPYPTTARDRAAGGGGMVQQPVADFAPGEYGLLCMVYGIDHNTISCDKLFNLLCLYGNVQRIKFMKSKLDTAMVQMAKPNEVQSIIDCLHGAQLFGQPLAFRPSKQNVLHPTREPFNMPDGSESFKDFTNNRHLRFSTPDSARRNKLIRPTHIIHWYNAPPDATEEIITQLFVKSGAKEPHKVTIFQGKSERSSSGLAEFRTAEEATDALVNTNHQPLNSDTSPNPYIVKMSFATVRPERDDH